MKAIIVLLAFLVPFVLSGCASSITETVDRPPDRVFFSGEDAADALSSLSLVADDMGLRTDLIDQRAGQIAISNPHPFLGHRMSLIVFKAEPQVDGSQISAWASGQNPIWWEWVDKIWERYSERLQSRNVQHRVVQGAD